MVPTYAGLVRYLAAACLTGTLGPATSAADLSAREVTRSLYQADAQSPPDFSGADLSFLDLSGLDFKRARLEGTRFHATDLTGANLSGSNLQRAILDRATLVKADFSQSNLRWALIRLPHSASDPNFDASTTPNFNSADLRAARVVGRFDGGKFRNANLERTDFGPYGDWTQNTLTRRSQFISADFTGSSLIGADFSEAILNFARFREADMAGINLTNATLIGADFTGANLVGANVTGADFESADLSAAKGLDRLIGKDRALNWPR